MDKEVKMKHHPYTLTIIETTPTGYILNIDFERVFETDPVKLRHVIAGYIRILKRFLKEIKKYEC